jgi:hypothetical protein
MTQDTRSIPKMNVSDELSYCKTLKEKFMRSFTILDLQYAYRFYGFKGKAQYLHGHTAILALEVEDTVNAGVNHGHLDPGITF